MVQIQNAENSAVVRYFGFVACEISTDGYFMPLLQFASDLVAAVGANRLGSDASNPGGVLRYEALEIKSCQDERNGLLLNEGLRPPALTTGQRALFHFALSF